MRIVSAALPAALILAVAGCTELTVPGRDTSPIAGNYAISRVNGAGVPAPGITMTLQPNGSFSGRSLCSTYSGRNANKYPGFKVGAFTQNRGTRACDRNLERVDASFFRALTQSTSLAQGSGGLSLQGGVAGENKTSIDATRR